MAQKKTVEVQFTKSFMYGGKERKPEDTEDEPFEMPLEDARFHVSNNQVKIVKDDEVEETKETPKPGKKKTASKKEDS